MTAQILGSRVELVSDVGVAGIHRLLAHGDKLRKAGVLVVVAGMEGALPSVVSGLVDRPVIESETNLASPRASVAPRSEGVPASASSPVVCLRAWIITLAPRPRSLPMGYRVPSRGARHSGNAKLEISLIAAGLEVSTQRLHFENSQHDFPRAIAYERTSLDSLTAKVFGEINSRPRISHLNLFTNLINLVHGEARQGTHPGLPLE